MTRRYAKSAPDSRFPGEPDKTLVQAILANLKDGTLSREYVLSFAEKE